MKSPLLDLEELVVDAWPALETEEIDGWLLRHSGGPGRGAETPSLFWTIRPSESSKRRSQRSSAWYAARQRPAISSGWPLHAPQGARSRARRAWAIAHRATAFAAAPAFPLSALSCDPTLRVRVSAKLEPDWLSVTTQAKSLRGQLGQPARLLQTARLALSLRDCTRCPCAPHRMLFGHRLRGQARRLRDHRPCPRRGDAAVRAHCCAVLARARERTPCASSTCWSKSRTRARALTPALAFKTSTSITTAFRP